MKETLSRKSTNIEGHEGDNSGIKGTRRRHSITFFCTHGFTRLCLVPHLRWGQKPLMLSLYIVLYPDVEEGVKLVEIKIRDVDPIAKKKLDEVAKKKKISRQKLLKGIIEMTAFMPEDTKREKELERLLEKNITAMENCYQAMEKMNQFLTLMGQEDLNE
jgi:hypothetical protein